jgi:hypothetical protein
VIDDVEGKEAQAGRVRREKIPYLRTERSVTTILNTGLHDG